MDEQTYELTISTLAYGGDALARLPDPDGKPGECTVFVPFALPGERVRVRLMEKSRSVALAELVEVIEAAPERIPPRCRHFGVCGGCHYQHMPYARQLEAKAGMLREQLRRLGKIADAPVEPMVPSPDPWNYRNHAQFHLTPDGRVGYFGAGLVEQPGETDPRRRFAPAVMPISECHLHEASISDLWPKLKFESVEQIERISIRAGTGGRLLLAVHSDAPGIPGLDLEAGVSIVQMCQGCPVVLSGDDHVVIRVLDRDFRVSAGSFFQVNTAMAGKMVEYVLAQLQTTNLPISQSTILDVYCGAGLFSAFLAPKCKRLIGIESSPPACDDFAANLDEFDNVELYEDLAEHVLPALDLRPDIILVDPPRAGLEEAALEAIVRLHPGTLYYVSCDPSTLARDAARLLQGGYRLRSIRPFDLFPQTYHIESISVFVDITADR